MSMSTATSGCQLAVAQQPLRVLEGGKRSSQGAAWQSDARTLQTGESITILKKAKHLLIGAGTDVITLEIPMGEFDESDTSSGLKTTTSGEKYIYYIIPAGRATRLSSLQTGISCPLRNLQRCPSRGLLLSSEQAARCPP
jgi:hypothetical protein